MTREEHLDRCLVQADARVRELETMLKAQVVAATNERIKELEEAARKAIEAHGCFSPEMVQLAEVLLKSWSGKKASIRINPGTKT